MKRINRNAGTAALCLTACLTFASDVFVANNQPAAYAAAMVISSYDLKNSANAYRPWYENGAWQGDLVEYDITSTGAISTSIDLSPVIPVNSGSNWSARLQFNAAETANLNYWDASRKIITWNGTLQQQVPFRWANLSVTQQEALDPTAFNDTDATSSSILNYVRGDRSNEKPTGTLRTRYNLLGDIMHSAPIYVVIGHFRTSLTSPIFI
jgi:Tfp pilus tip-associated adhesin PilY1